MVVGERQRFAVFCLAGNQDSDIYAARVIGSPHWARFEL
jgi:hypothetical protein